MEEGLFQQVQRLATSNKRTVSNMINVLVEEALSKRRAESRLYAECSPSDFEQKALAE